MFLIKPLFETTSRQKFKCHESEKKIEGEEYFPSFLKGFQCPKCFLTLDSAPLMLWNSTSWSRLKLTVQIQLALHPCDPFLINNRIMIGKIVEKCFAVWNVIQNVLMTLKPNIYCFCLVIYVTFAYPSNKRIIDGPYSYKKYIFRVYYFSEQVAAKRNSLEATWEMVSGKFPPIKLPLVDFLPGKFTPRKSPPGKFPPMFLNIPNSVL